MDTFRSRRLTPQYYRLEEIISSALLDVEGIDVMDAFPLQGMMRRIPSPSAKKNNLAGVSSSSPG